MTAETPKRGKPWALLAVLGGILLTTFAMCGVGGWLFVDAVRTTVDVRDASQGPLEVRDEAHHVVLRRQQLDRDVELFTRAASHQTFEDGLLRRIDPECDTELRARTVGAEAEIGPWLDLIANRAASAPETSVLIEGIGSGIQRKYADNEAREFTLIGFIQGDTLLTLDISGDPEVCPQRLLNSIRIEDGPLAPTTHVQPNITAPTFEVRDGHFEGFTSGLHIEVPESFRISDRNTELHWDTYDEAILVHDNGTEIRIAVSTTAFPEEDYRCQPMEASEHQLQRVFDGQERLFVGEARPPRWMYETEYCAGRMVVAISAIGPSETRASQAISALSGRVTTREPVLRDVPGHQRRGERLWSYRNDVYVHSASGMTWRRPAFFEVRTNGASLRRDGYPESTVQFDFLRRDVNVSGSVWAHYTELSAEQYHAAFRSTSFGDDTEASAVEPVRIGNCEGSSSTLTVDAVRVVSMTCVQHGQAIAIEYVAPSPGAGDSAAVSDATRAILAAFAEEEPSTSPEFHLTGSEVTDAGPEVASATLRLHSLRLNITRYTAWSGSVAHERATSVAFENLSRIPRFRGLARARVFAPTTELRATEVSGFAAEERRLVIGTVGLRVYTVLIDATAYVITSYGPAATPESAWSELLATVHIDP